MRTALRESIRGKGLWRAMLYDAMRSSGMRPPLPILDMACGADPGYWRILGLRRADIVTADIDAVTRPSLVCDISAGNLPFSDGFFGSVFLMNCLYAFPDPLAVMKEACRILRPDSIAVMSFPLVFPYTPEPRDFHRFTEEAIRRLCAESGFSSEFLVPIGGRWASAAYLISPFLRPVLFFAVPVYVVTRFLDGISNFLFPILPRAPIGYFVIARKT